VGQKVTKAVFDSNVIISGAGWRTAGPYGCLVLMARRRVQVFTSDWILEEVSRNLKQMMGERVFRHDPTPVFRWFEDR